MINECETLIDKGATEGSWGPRRSSISAIREILSERSLSDFLLDASLANSAADIYLKHQRTYSM